MSPTKIAPNRGETRTIVPMIIDNMPTPTRKALAHPECFPDIPSTILAQPLKISAMPTKTVTTSAVATGNEIARPANIRTSIPRPIVAHFPLTGRKMYMRIHRQC